MIIGTIEQTATGSIVLHVRGKPGLRHPLRGSGANATRFRADIGSIKSEYVGRRIVTKADGHWSLETRFPLYSWRDDRKATRAHLRHFIAAAVDEKAKVAALPANWSASASTMSQEWAERVQLFSLRQLARKSLEYARYRAFMRGAYPGWPGDKLAHDLWHSLGER